MKIYNTLTRQVEEFQPIEDKKVGMYSCGPTVYGYNTIGNLRTYILCDILKRALLLDGYEVTHIMNITDVGHLVEDADEGEDKLEKKAKEEGKSAWDIAKFYTEAFFNDIDSLNIIRADKYPRASEHVKEQVDMIKVLIDKGFAYITPSAVYFDIEKFKEYGRLSGQSISDKVVHAREEIVEDKNKRHPVDFRLWQLDQKKHQMQWDSPWGKGFPGWHIECSAMSIKYLGNHFDIHLGGADLITPHHDNEIAQSEAFSGEKFANYWVHGEFITVEGKRMGKSQGNAYTLADLREKGYESLALRYLYLTAHYRSKLNFTWDALQGAQRSLDKLRDSIVMLREKAESDIVSERYENMLLTAINNDLNMPQVLGIMWDMMKDEDMNPKEKLGTLYFIDNMLGLNLKEYKKEKIPQEIDDLLEKRRLARDTRNWDESDRIRKELLLQGYIIEDTNEGQKVSKRSHT